MIKNSFRVAFLGIVAFALLMYMTMPNHQNSAKAQAGALNIDSIPKYFDVVYGRSAQHDSWLAYI